MSINELEELTERIESYKKKLATITNTEYRQDAESVLELLEKAKGALEAGVLMKNIAKHYTKQAKSRFREVEAKWLKVNSA